MGSWRLVGCALVVTTFLTFTVDTPGVSTVKVKNVVTTNAEPTKRHDPNHPLADANGDVWEAAVDGNAELIDMIETARMYQNNVQVLNTAKSLMMETIRIGK